jgi:signal transduction histidine kinase
MALVFTSRDRQQMTERFAEVLENSQTEHDEQLSRELLAGIAEMAAGAAHELNNPLAVISGRTQILLKAETNDKKKKVLNQINKKTQQLSAIITDLMAFAKPKEPASRTLPLRQLLDEAVDLAAKQSTVDVADVRFESIENLGSVFVDQQQTTEAIANIISNATQSYPQPSGSVMISGDCPQPASMVSFQIIDSGSGMDTETLAKAAEPFFSGKEAGRRRGMGLAFAERLLLLNKAAMEITSQPASGTTVTIRLPASE